MNVHTVHGAGTT